MSIWRQVTRFQFCDVDPDFGVVSKETAFRAHMFREVIDIRQKEDRSKNGSLGNATEEGSRRREALERQPSESGHIGKL